MTATMNPYVVFLDRAEEALAFYQGVLGGTVTLSRFAEFGLADTPDADKIMHGMLRTPEGFTLMCGDTPAGMAHEPGSTVMISLSGDDTAALRRWFAGLAEGATVSVPLERQMWGDEFGQLTDRFGVTWVVDIADPDPSTDGVSAAGASVSE